jgi:LacI family transcriptional regulator
MPPEVKHDRILQALLADIASGQYGPGHRLPSEAQLVRRFGVSRPTAARALRDLRDRGVIERRVGSGSFVKEAPSPEAVGSRQLGLLIPDLGMTEVFEAICGELAGQARGRGYGLVWGAGHTGRFEMPGIEAAPSLCEPFIASQIAGVFFAPFEGGPEHTELNQAVANTLRVAGVTVVLLDRDLAPFPLRSPYDLVGIDNFSAGFTLAEHLLKLGCRRLAFVARRHSAPTVNARVAGAREALRAQGLDVPPDFLRVGNPESADLVDTLIGPHAGPALDAVICANDHTAALLLRSVERRGVSVPQDLRIVGFDDLRLATVLRTPLTTMHQPCRDIAMVALQTMLSRLADPALPARNITIAARLVIRESCGTYSQKAHSGVDRAANTDQDKVR